MRRWLPFAVGLAAVAGAALLARGGRDARVESADPGTPGEGPGLDARPAAAAAAAPRAAPATARIEGVVVRDGAPCTATIEVYVRPDGASPAGDDARIEVADDGDDEGALPAATAPAPTATIAAGADGRFALDVAVPATASLVAHAADGARAGANARVDVAGERVVLDVELPVRTTTLSGRALHADGRPFHGIVSVTPPRDRVAAAVGWRRTTTDADGRFQFTGLPGGAVQLRADVPGRFGWTSPLVTLPRTAPLELVVDRGARDVDGRVVDAESGAPIAGAAVGVRAQIDDGDVTHVARATTDAEGRFAVLAPPGGAVWFAAARGYERSEVLHAEPLPAPVVLALARRAPPPRVAGRVDVEGGVAPAGLPVSAWAAWGEAVAQGTTDGDGRFAFDAPARPVTAVLVHGRGWTTHDLANSDRRGADPVADATAAGLPERVVVRAVRAGAIAGRVIDADGRPIARASVSILRQSGALRMPRTWDVDARARAATDADGRFLLDTVVPGAEVEVYAWPPDADAPLHRLVSVDGGRTTDVVLEGEPTRAVEVRVATPDGTPVAGVGVQALVEHAGGWSERVTEVETGAAGRVVLRGMPRRPLVFEVRPRGYGVDGESSARLDEHAVGPVSFVVRPARVVAGVVRWADGSPAAAQAVELRVGERVRGATDDAGAFRFDDGVPEGAFEIVVPADVEDAAPRATASARAGSESVVLTLAGPPPPRTIVRVLGPDGAPLSAVRVVVSTGGDDYAPGSAYPSYGRASVAPWTVPAWIFVRRWARGTLVPVPLGPALVGPVAPGTAEVEVRLPPEATIEGTVRDAQGRGVAGALVAAVPAFPGREHFAMDPWESPESATTGADGRFRLGGMPSGPVRLGVRPPAGFEAPPGVVVEAGARDVVVHVGAYRALDVAVVDDDGAPVVGARLSAHAAGRADAWASTRLDGRASLVGFDAETPCTLDVVPPRDRDDLQATHVDRFTPALGPVRLPRGFPVRGVVRDARGESYAGVVVERVTPHGRDGRCETDAAGRFSMPGLAAGEVALVAHTSPPRIESDAVVVRAGDEHVVLVVERSTVLRVRLAGFSAATAAGWEPPYVGLVDERGGDATESAPIDGDGVASIRVRPSGTYRVWTVFHREGRPALVARRAGMRGDAGSVEVPLTPALTIEGRVALPDGAGAVDVVARDAAASSDGQDAEVETDGRFRLEGLTAGRWRLDVTVKVGERTWGATTEVEAGASGVVLDPKPPR